MGPRPIRRGNTLKVAYAQRIFGLQWGHVQSDVETVDATHNKYGSRGSFNGATSNQTWKHFFMEQVPHGAHELQWGHVQSDVETWKALFPTVTRG